MRITQEADYAIRIVSMLAEKNDRVDACSIAQETMITQRFALKILRKLVGAEIVKSYKGSAGGYVLGKEPCDITLLEIVETIDGPIQIIKCIDKNHVCSKVGCNKSECVMHNIFVNISEKIASTLGSITIEMLNNGDEAIFKLFCD